MAFPVPPLDFIVPNNPHLSAGWQSEFGEYRWFRLAGWAEHFADLRTAVGPGQRVSCDGVGKFTIHAKAHVPTALQQVLPTGGWNEFATLQIRRCDAGDPLTFDKACLVAAAFDLYASHIHPGTNHLHRMRITPAIYVLRGFDMKLWGRIKTHSSVGGTPFLNALMQHTEQLYPLFFLDLAYGHSATYRTLELIIEFLKQHKMADGLSIEQMTDRNYPGKVYPPEFAQRAGDHLQKRPALKETVSAHP